MAGECIAYREKRGCAGLWWGKLREWDHWRDRQKCEDNFMSDFQEVGFRGIDWTELAQGRDK
jgi:hypothetical protein